jgi:SAM-dependent methyltransferase
MKITPAAARTLAASLGVPERGSLQILDWNLSWVANAEERIEALARELAEGAVAYIEYDAYPGFRFQEVLRDLEGFHCRDIQDLKERREQTMAILGFVANAGQHSWVRSFLQGEMERLRSLTLEAFDREFAPARKAYRQQDLVHLFAKYGLRCWMEAPGFNSDGYAFVMRGAEPAQAQAEPNSLYHEVEYPEYLHAALHPERLFTMARAFGLTPPPIENCRVLELGCGQGITMLNTALDLRSSSFVGVDFSQIQIDKAKSSAQELGLTNTTFLAMDIADFDATYGDFDYIVAHGVYSWVPDAVREKLLAICRDSLRPNGIAYLCFNAKPGYRFPGMIRDLGLESAGGRIAGRQQAAEVFQRMKSLSTEALPPHRQAILEPYISHFSEADSGQAMYDELADINHPYLFDEVATEAQRFGLKFFAESDIKAWSIRTLDSSAQQLLDGLLEDPIKRLQYRAFLCMTRFHTALFCHQDRKPAYAPLASAVEAMLYTLRGKPGSANPDVRGDKPEVFIGPGGVEVNIGDPLLKAALVILYLEHPVRFSFDRLLQEASQLAAVEPDAEKLRRWLLPLWETGFLDTHSHRPPIVTEISEKPVAHSLARLCALESRKVPSLLGSGAELADDRDRDLLRLLDGTRDLEDLEQAMGLNHDELISRLQAIARLGLLTV